MGLKRRYVRLATAQRRRTYGCNHATERFIFDNEGDGCWWCICLSCGRRGPKKHTRALAEARFRSVGTRVRGRARVVYDGTAARDDQRFSTGAKQHD